jgi:hypothetical protein
MKELHDFYEQNITVPIKKMRWLGYVTRMGDMIKV